MVSQVNVEETMDLLPVAWKLTEAPSAVVVVITAVPVPTLLIWKIYPPETFFQTSRIQPQGWKKSRLAARYCL